MIDIEIGHVRRDSHAFSVPRQAMQLKIEPRGSGDIDLAGDVVEAGRAKRDFISAGGNRFKSITPVGHGGGQTVAQLRSGCRNRFRLRVGDDSVQAPGLCENWEKAAKPRD